MTLLEMSDQYADSAALIRARIRELRAEKKVTNSPTASHKIDQRINALTPRQRQMLEMRFEQNMKISEISEELGVNRSTVSRTIIRAKKNLRSCLKYSF